MKAAGVDVPGPSAPLREKTKIMASGPITSWQIDGETVETVSDFIFLGSKITADGDCNHEIKSEASASVLPINIQGSFPLGLTDLISLQSKGLSGVFSNTTVQKHVFFGTQLPLWSQFSHPCMPTGKTSPEISIPGLGLQPTPRTPPLEQRLVPPSPRALSLI